jgi:hypothetical protein
VITRKQPDGSLLIMGQTDHSQLVGQLAAHWGNPSFERPRPYESVVRGATYHDFGWLTYETNPSVDDETGEPMQFRGLPTGPAQLASYQACVDWLTGIDPYSGLLVSMHRTGLWRARYEKIGHPAARYTPHGANPGVDEFISRNETWQEAQRAAIGGDTIWTSYHLLQVWDLLGLYFCCQEPYPEHIEPVPERYGPDGGGVRLELTPSGGNRVSFAPYPFDVRPLPIQIVCRRVPQSTFPSQEAFREAYFRAQRCLVECEIDGE